MDKTNIGYSTPSGRLAEKLENPPSKEVGPMDSEEGQLLLEKVHYGGNAMKDQKRKKDQDTTKNEDS